MTLPPGFLTESNKLDILFLLTAHAGSHLALAVAGHLTLLILDHFPNHFSADGSILSGCQVSVVAVREPSSLATSNLKRSIALFASGTAVLLDERFTM